MAKTLKLVLSVLLAVGGVWLLIVLVSVNPPYNINAKLKNTFETSKQKINEYTSSLKSQFKSSFDDGLNRVNVNEQRLIDTNLNKQQYNKQRRIELYEKQASNAKQNKNIINFPNGLKNEKEYLTHDFIPQLELESQNLTQLSLQPITKSRHDDITLQLSVVRTHDDQLVRTKGYEELNYNLLVSNRIGLLRKLPSPNLSKRCLNETILKKNILNIYDEQNKQQQQQKIKQLNSTNTNTSDFNNTKQALNASIIIAYYNESPSALLRCIYSILARTPLEYIAEILIVDDYSDTNYSSDVIHPLVNSSLVKFYRTASREGLIKAKLFGVRQTQGDLLIFIDSKVEVNNNWFLPLYETIINKEKALACPVVDVINSDTFIYSFSPLMRGGMTQTLQFKWDSSIANKSSKLDDLIKSYKSPIMLGLVFAVHRKYFHHLGGFDSGMIMQGGENMELSLRVWMCGGEILIVPCSRVGCIFNAKHNDNNGKEYLQNNNLRIAKIWLNDTNKEQFITLSSKAQSQNIDEMIELKKRLNCRDFDWFQKNIYKITR